MLDNEMGNQREDDKSQEGVGSRVEKEKKLETHCGVTTRLNTSEVELVETGWQSTHSQG